MLNDAGYLTRRATKGLVPAVIGMSVAVGALIGAVIVMAWPEAPIRPDAPKFTGRLPETSHSCVYARDAHNPGWMHRHCE